MEDPRIDTLFKEIEKIKKKLREIESVIDDQHGTLGWSPFDKFNE